MSIKKWQQLEKEKAGLEEQEQQIRQEFKMNKINKEFGQLSGEELFKPITKRLDKAAKEPEPAEELAAPDYEMDEFDINPDEFRPDAETPPPSPSAEEDKAQASRKAWESPEATSFLKTARESLDLRIIKSLITRFGDNPDYRIKSKKSKYYNRSIRDLEGERDELLRGRGELPQPDDASGGTEGSGLGEPDFAKLMEQLHVRLGSIKAGNTLTNFEKRLLICSSCFTITA